MLSALRDLLVLPECLGCGAVGVPWCDDCRALPLHRARLAAGMPVDVCLRYEGPVRRALVAWKEQADAAATSVVRSWLRDGLEPILEACPQARLVPVPSSRRALRRRGREPLAEALEGAWPGRVEAGWLVAARERVDQVGLDRAERERNLAGSLRWEGPTRGHIIFVDDVVTTGATLRECARAAAVATHLQVRGFAIAQRERRDPVAGAQRGLRLP